MRSAFSLRRTVTAIIAVAVMALLSPMPANASASLIVTPDSGLVDHQRVSVEGSGFTPNVTVRVEECFVGGSGPSVCDYSTASWPWTDSTGYFTTSWTTDPQVRRVIYSDNGPLDCAPANCIILVTEVESGNSMSAPLAFDPTVPPRPVLSVGVAVDANGTVVAKNGLITVRGSITCNVPADILLYGTAYQRSGQIVKEADLSGSLHCDGGVAQWQVIGDGNNGTFRAGRADVYMVVTGYAYAGTEVRHANTTMTVKLVGVRQIA